MSWEKVKLDELYEVHNGLSKGRQFFGSGHPFLSFSTVFNNYFIPPELYDLVESTEKEQKAQARQGRRSGGPVFQPTHFFYRSIFHPISHSITSGNSMV